MRTIGSNMLWNSVGSIFYLGCQWIITILVVRLSSSYADAGILSLAMAISTALWGCASLNLRAFQVADAEESRFTDGEYLLNRVFSSAAAIIFCLLFVLFGNYSKNEIACIATFMFFKISEAIVDVFHGVDQKAWRLDIAGKSFVMRGIAIVAAFVLGFKLFHSLLAGIILMCVFTYLIILFYDYRTCKREIGFQHNAAIKNALSLIRIGLPLGIYMSLLNTIGAFPRISIEKILGEEVLGVFASISAPTVIIMQGASFVFNPLVGLFAKSWKTHDSKGFFRVFALCVSSIAAIALAAILFSVFCGEFFLVILFGESIRESSYMLLPIVILSIMTAIIWFLGCIYTVVEDFSWIAWSTLVSTVVCLLCSDWLVNTHHMLGAVFATGTGLGLEIVLLTVRLVFTIKKHTAKSAAT